MKKILAGKLFSGAIVVLVLLGGAVLLYRDQITMVLAFSRLEPAQMFAAAMEPAAPDYADTASWAALPDRQDAADALPVTDVQDVQASAPVDVFFVHPTTYFGTGNWNQAVDDAGTNLLTDMFVMRGQASVFNNCCRIYAPRYRQATLYSFMDDTESSRAALAVAYQDVERAFDYYMEHFNQGRPFILAAHSQGSLHVSTLLTRRITGTPLRERLVASYPIGFPFDRNELARTMPDVPVCESAEQVGCLVTWNAIGPSADKWRDTSQSVCVNPLTWRADNAAADRALNLGALTYPGKFAGTIADMEGMPQEYIDAKPVLEPGAADARCIDGMLLVSDIHSDNYGARPMGRDNYHVYDYNLFYMNLRQNAELRVAQYLAAHQR